MEDIQKMIEGLCDLFDKGILTEGSVIAAISAAIEHTEKGTVLEKIKIKNGVITTKSRIVERV
ncbi:MAG: hypothetical protein ACTSXG_03425 [Alphaproteobacteria bacterium]